MTVGIAGCVAASSVTRVRADELSRRLGIAHLSRPPERGLYLEAAGDGLALCRAGDEPLRLRPDFLGGRQGYRAARVSARREAIARACGLTRRSGLWIVDATAGLGRDAFVLALLGARVTLLERSAVVTALLADALVRAGDGHSAVDAVARMDVHCTAAGEYLAALRTAGERPPVVYLDPMFEATGRRSRVRKDLQLLQELLGPPEPPRPLLEAALATATERVVVKRPRKAPPLGDRRPHHQIRGRSTRFDVYPV